jgi:hypothetical protein
MATTLTSTPNLSEQRRAGGLAMPPVLRNHPTQSAATITGWKAVSFGLPFLVAGVLIECAALDLLRGHKNAPAWLIGLLGGLFFSAGSFLVVHGLRGAARKAEHERESASRPGEPWLADHHWEREGVRFSAFYSMLQRLVAALVWNAFLVPFFWVGLNQRGLGRALDCQLFHVHWARLLGALDSDACGPIPQWQQFPEL